MRLCLCEPLKKRLQGVARHAKIKKLFCYAKTKKIQRLFKKVPMNSKISQLSQKTLKFY